MSHVQEAKHLVPPKEPIALPGAFLSDPNTHESHCIGRPKAAALLLFNANCLAIQRSFLMKNLFISAILFLATSIAFCQTSTGYNTAQQSATVAKATVVGVRDVTYAAPNSGFGGGTMVGGAIGAALGTTVGGFIGNAMANRPVAAQEIILAKAGGEIIAITQSLEDGVRFAVGQPVLLIGQGRVVPSPL
jgi:outer membrane lipoprotein SlyB